MSAEIISFSEYKRKLQEEELDRLKAEVDAIIESLPEEDNTVGWYTNINYNTWWSSGLDLEYVYEQPKECPCCGKSYNEE